MQKASANLLICHDHAHTPQPPQVYGGCKPAQTRGLLVPPLLHPVVRLVCSSSNAICTGAVT